MNARRVLLGAISLALCVFVPGRSKAVSQSAALAQALISGLDYDAARHELADADPLDAPAALERARLALYELDCDGSAAILVRPDVQAVPGADSLSEIARGCQRVTAALAVDRDSNGGIDVYWQDDHDRALAPLVFETVRKARAVLTRDLGTDWPRPTRIVIVRDALSLSAMTGLPYASAVTTGTVAVAKWGRVTMLTPRASPHGFAWRDTLAHELSHLALTRATRDRAPLWLQEGIAKREEVRWRDPGPFDDRPPPESIVRHGEDSGQFIPLDKLGPSIGMLPSADLAMVAFAEVTSFVRFYMATAGDVALPRLLRELKGGATPDAALMSVTGADLSTWNGRWRAYVSAMPRSPATGTNGSTLHGGRVETKDERDRIRLAQLLLARNHADEALTELDPVRQTHDDSTGAEALADPGLLWLRGRALELAGKRSEAEPLAGNPADVASSFAPWWAMRGRWVRLRGDEPEASRSFIESISADPFDIEGACETVVGPPTLPNAPAPKATPLCDAARAYPPPPFDSD